MEIIKKLERSRTLAKRIGDSFYGKEQKDNVVFLGASCVRCDSWRKIKDIEDPVERSKKALEFVRSLC